LHCDADKKTMKILVVSDTHGHSDLLQRCFEINKPIDLIIHCGDGLIDLKRSSVPDGASLFYVAGNIDLQSHIFSDEASMVIENILGKRVLITHGHNHHVKSGLHLLKKEAMRLSVDIVLFGHTHSQEYIKNGITLFNPGNLSSGYFGIVTVEDSSWKFEHKKL